MRERERERKKERKKERERKWIEWRVGSLTFVFGSGDIKLQLSNSEQTTISEAQKRKNTFFRITAITHQKFEIINNFKFSDKT
jgi:hypothetical protein